MARKPKILIVEVIDRFLVAQRSCSSAGTQRWYNNYLRQFARRHGTIRCDELTPSVVHRWLADNYGKCSASTQHAAARCVVRAFNWAVEERLIAESPLRGFRKPAPSSRECSLTPAQYAHVMRAAGDTQRYSSIRPIRDIIKFLWHSGARPQELRIIEARWVVDGTKIIIPQELSKGKRKRRVIRLNSTAANIVARLSHEWPEGPIFRNTRGESWKKDAMTLAFRRLRERTKIEGLCAYVFRHAYITRKLEAGVDVATVAALAGNSARMVLTAYNHVSQNEQRLDDIINA